MTSSFVSLEVNYQVFLKKKFFCGFSTTYDFSQIEKKKYILKFLQKTSRRKPECSSAIKLLSAKVLRLKISP